MKKNIYGFVNGCFDVLHVGHIQLLEYAKNKCDILVVGIDSDTRVGEIKGPDRPFNNQEDRKKMLLSLKFVDHVEIFNSSMELENLILETNPDIMVVGSDWRDKCVVGAQYARKLLFFDRINGYSTTKILENSPDRR